jgi:aryl-alcohol dehydrogenase-like predicted oxidoreductase
MKYRELGNTGVNVSEIGFGAWGIGGNVKNSLAYGPTDNKVSIRALERAFEKGVTLYDTSPLYGYGHSEKLIGSTFKKHRDQIIIASKVGYLDFDGEQNFTKEHIRKSLEESLRRLQTDYIDIFQLHDPPMSVLQKDSDIFSILESLQDEGKIRLIGISTKSPDESILALEKYDFKSIQVNFSLIDQRALENGLFQKCEEKGVGIIGRTPLCFGFLTGKYDAKQSFPSSDHRSLWSKEQVGQWANAYKLFGKEIITKEHQTNAQIALRFCLSYSALSTTIPGLLTDEHVNENSHSSELGAFPDSVIEKFRIIYNNNVFFTPPKKL